jgi:hypothetical protein
MITVCNKCQTTYDDALALTYCPHSPLMPAHDMNRKIAAIQLMDRARGKYLRFRRPSKISGKYRLMAVLWDGMVEVEGLSGKFSPGSFEVTE